MATNYDGYLFPPIHEIVCLLKLVAGEHRWEDADTVFLLKGFLEAGGWPLCEQNGPWV